MFNITERHLFEDV